MTIPQVGYSDWLSHMAEDTLFRDTDDKKHPLSIHLFYLPSSQKRHWPEFYLALHCRLL
jgi:hypothetical protein